MKWRILTFATCLLFAVFTTASDVSSRDSEVQQTTLLDLSLAIENTALYPALSDIGASDTPVFCRLGVACRTIRLAFADPSTKEQASAYVSNDTSLVTALVQAKTGTFYLTGDVVAEMTDSGHFYFSKLVVNKASALLTGDTIELSFKVIAKDLSGVSFSFKVAVLAEPDFAVQYPIVRTVFQGSTEFPSSAIVVAAIQARANIHDNYRVSLVNPIGSPIMSGAVKSYEVYWRPICAALLCNSMNWDLATFVTNFFEQSALPLIQYVQEQNGVIADPYAWPDVMSGYDATASEFYWGDMVTPLDFTVVPQALNGGYTYLSGTNWDSICLAGDFCKSIAAKVSSPAFTHEPGLMCHFNVMNATYNYSGHRVQLGTDGTCFFHNLVVLGASGVVSVKFHAESGDGKRKTEDVFRTMRITSSDESIVRVIKMRTGIDFASLNAEKSDLRTAIQSGAPSLSLENINIIRAAGASSHAQTIQREGQAQAISCGVGTRTDIEFQFQSDVPSSMNAHYGSFLQDATTTNSDLSRLFCGIAEASSEWRSAAIQQTNSSSFPADFAPSLTFYKNTKTTLLGSIVNLTTLVLDSGSVSDNVCYFGFVCQTMLLRFESNAETITTIQASYPSIKYSLVVDLTISGVKSALDGTVLDPNDFTIIQSNTDLGGRVPWSDSAGVSVDETLAGNWFSLYRIALHYKTQPTSLAINDMTITFAPKILDLFSSSVVDDTLPTSTHTFRVRNQPFQASSGGRLIEYHPSVIMAVGAKTEDPFTSSFQQFLREKYLIPVYYKLHTLQVTSDTTVTNLNAVAVPIKETCYNATNLAELYIFFLQCDTSLWAVQSGTEGRACPEPEVYLNEFVGDLSNPANNNIYPHFCAVHEFLRFLAKVDTQITIAEPSDDDDSSDGSYWWVLLFLAFICCVSGGVMFARGMRMKQKTQKMRETRDSGNGDSTELAPFAPMHAGYVPHKLPPALRSTLSQYFSISPQKPTRRGDPPCCLGIPFTA